MRRKGRRGEIDDEDEENGGECKREGTPEKERARERACARALKTTSANEKDSVLDRATLV